MAWVPALGGWLVTSHAAAMAVMRDARAFTVDDPRFSTARVIGPSMLSLDGAAHARHRAPFFSAFHRGDAAARLGTFADAEASRLVAAIRPHGAADLRRAVSGPLAVTVVAEALGLGHLAPDRLLSAYARIVGGVNGLSGDQDVPGANAGITPPDPDPDAAAAYGQLAADLRAAAGGRNVLADAARSGDLSTAEAVSDAAVVMFGGIDTTDGMIANAVLHLLSDPGQLELVRVDPHLVPAVIEESLRLEPAAALVDRYATRDAQIGGAAIRAGDRVSVSLAAANRDPAVFRDPDRFDIFRPNTSRHLAFAYGPHFCIGAALARAETRAALQALLPLPRLRLDPEHPAAPRGLIFRKPPALDVIWDT